MRSVPYGQTPLEHHLMKFEHAQNFADQNIEFTFILNSIVQGMRDLNVEYLYFISHIPKVISSRIIKAGIKMQKIDSRNNDYNDINALVNRLIVKDDQDRTRTFQR